MVNNRHLILKVLGLILLILCIQSGFYKSYGIEKGPVVVVREMDLRFGPVPLPLNENTKNALMIYLKSGGDKMSSTTAPYYFKMKASYRALIHFLSGKNKINVNDIFITQKGIYRINPIASKWFKGPVVYSIIDATQKRPLSEKSYSPLAVSDGYLWWIFYRDNRTQFDQLLVTVPVSGEIAQIREP